MYYSRAALLKVVTPWSIYYSRAALLKVVTPGTNTFKPSASNQDTKSESTAVGLFGKIVPIVHQMYSCIASESTFRQRTRLLIEN